MKHFKGEIIFIKGEYWKCICCDNDGAIFASCNQSGTKINYKKLKAVYPGSDE